MDLTGLQGDAEYEVRIRAMNHQGWSQLSDPFYFKTSGKWSLLNTFGQVRYTEEEWHSSSLKKILCYSVLNSIRLKMLNMDLFTFEL